MPIRHYYGSSAIWLSPLFPELINTVAGYHFSQQFSFELELKSRTEMTVITSNKRMEGEICGIKKIDMENILVVNEDQVEVIDDKNLSYFVD